jgi:hypothetical protein
MIFLLKKNLKYALKEIKIQEKNKSETLTTPKYIIKNP